MGVFNRLRFGVVCGVLLALGAPRAAAILTVECVPVEGSAVTGAEVVEVECFLTTDITRTFVAAQLDLACSLPGKPGSSGSMTSVGISVEPLHQPEPFFLAGVGGNWTINNPLCAVAIFPTFGVGQVTIPAGATVHLATIHYRVSDCATGEFNIILESADNPPNSVGTRFFGPGGQIYLFEAVPATIAVTTGACCLMNSCTQDGINEFCCVDSEPGARFVEGGSCSDPDPCPCVVDGDCADGIFCNGAEVCIEELGCIPGEIPCQAAGFICDEEAGRCRDVRIPTISGWGLVMLAIMLATVGRIRFRP